MFGVPAIAVSQAHVRSGAYDFRAAARFTARFAQAMHRLGRHAPMLVSINVPASPKGVKAAPAGGAPFDITGFQQTGTAADGATTYKAQLQVGGRAPAGSDTRALQDGYITVTALSLDPALRNVRLPREALRLPGSEQPSRTGAVETRKRRP